MRPLRWTRTHHLCQHQQHWWSHRQSTFMLPFLLAHSYLLPSSSPSSSPPTSSCLFNKNFMCIPLSSSLCLVCFYGVITAPINPPGTNAAVLSVASSGQTHLLTWCFVYGKREKKLFLPSVRTRPSWVAEKRLECTAEWHFRTCQNPFCWTSCTCPSESRASLKLLEFPEYWHHINVETSVCSSVFSQIFPASWFLDGIFIYINL